MDTAIIFTYIQSYGYFIIFLFLFFGIIGIPAPEESLLFFLGVLVAQQQLLWAYCFIVSWFGATMGMLTAYGMGFFFGHPFMKKYGKYIGMKAGASESVVSKVWEVGHFIWILHSGVATNFTVYGGSDSVSVWLVFASLICRGIIMDCTDCVSWNVFRPACSRSAFFYSFNRGRLLSSFSYRCMAETII
jgi:membrane protein YqaA with SNARE-associated domain